MVNNVECTRALAVDSKTRLLALIILDTNFICKTPYAKRRHFHSSPELFPVTPDSDKGRNDRGG
jgi:hypothetical protein